MNILVTIPVKDDQRERINKAAAGHSVEYIPLGELKQSDVRGREIIIGNIPLHSFPMLTRSAGYSSI